MAHETAHIANDDVLFMTLASLMTGAAGGAGWFAGRESGRRHAVRFGGEAPVFTLGHRFLRACSGFLALFAPVYGVLILAGVARRRDYLADACAALYTRYPEGLASALYVMAGSPNTLLQRNPRIATLCTLNPHRKEHGIHTPLLAASTHAPVKERISILRRIHNVVSYEGYERAWREATGASRRLFPKGAVTDRHAYPIRDGHPAATVHDVARRQVRDAGDLMRGMGRYVFLACGCSMRIKLPPWHARDHAVCPRCGRDVRVPTAHALPKASPTDASAEVAELARPGKLWLTFRCVCGARNQLSPYFDAPRMVCAQCGRGIRIRDAATVD
ncbi:MAG TPA: M48 family metalloprotease [Candidatus Hydrogenedentes bacterium]|nr:M48 family metalloprotease [Candidatus Hydrogenedentota bacterium]